MNRKTGLLAGALALAAAPLAAAAVNTFKTPKKTSVYAPKPAKDLKLAQKLSKMVQNDTTSIPNTYEPEKFKAFHQTLEELFPLVHAHLDKTEIDGNLLFHWKGKSSERPMVLMAHQDVVPASGNWQYPPFSGTIAYGKVWGRGAADTKCSLMAFFEAVEQLLAQGYVPEQDVYLSSSCTEEWGGDGCPKLVAELERRDVHPFLVLDEGGGIITDPIAGIKGNFAMVGLFEKGKADVVFKATSHGGHASAPKKNTPVDRLAEFVHDVKTHPYFQVEIEPEVQAMFENLALYAPLGMRYLFSNLWLFKPLLKKVMPAISAQGAAMMQTTVAFTTMKGSEAFNVIPQEAQIGANLRFIPHQDEKESLAILESLAHKYGLEMEVVHSNPSTKAVDTAGAPYQLVKNTLHETFKGLPVSSYVVTGATDAQFYQRICDNCIRFSPVIYGPEQMKGMHGLDENIEISCLQGAVDFYKNLIQGNH